MSSFMNRALQWSHRIDIPADIDIYKAAERFVAETSKKPHFCLRIAMCVVVHVGIDCLHDEIDVCTRHILHAAICNDQICCHRRLCVHRPSTRDHNAHRMTEAAQDCFDGYSVMFNTRGDAHRRGRCADKAAEEGIAPWKIGMLAACLCMWDTMWGVRARRV